MKAVFVFCEGNHDITFAARSLGQVGGATWLGRPIKDLPSPLGEVPDPGQPKPIQRSFIASRYSGRTLDGLRLQAAAHPPPPAFMAVLSLGPTGGQSVYVLLRCSGDSAALASATLLEEFRFQLLPNVPTDIKEYAAAFLFDADGSLADREAAFARDYSALFGASGAPTHGLWVKGKDFPVGLYVFHDHQTKTGTLEDVLAPMVQMEWPARWAAADNYLTAHSTPADPVSKKTAEKLKAHISITGQFVAPGDPMSEVIGRDVLPDTHFTGGESKTLVTFLQGVPW